MSELNLKKLIRTIPNFPRPGIMFRDITPMLADPLAFRSVIDKIAGRFRESGVTDVIAADERGANSLGFTITVLPAAIAATTGASDS